MNSAQRLSPGAQEGGLWEMHVGIIKGFGIVNKADVFLELSCFFNDPTDAGNLISGSSAFSKSSLNILWDWNEN